MSGYTYQEAFGSLCLEYTNIMEGRFNLDLDVIINIMSKRKADLMIERIKRTAWRVSEGVTADGTKITDKEHATNCQARC